MDKANSNLSYKEKMGIKLSFNFWHPKSFTCCLQMTRRTSAINSA